MAGFFVDSDNDSSNRFISMTLNRPISRLSFNPIVLVSLFLFVLVSEAYAESVGCSRIGIFNNTPNYQLDISIDGRAPFTLCVGKCKSVSLGGDGATSRHEMVVKAYVRSKYLGRRQMGEVSTMTFEMPGTEKSSPLGKVGWYHVFTYHDFLPRLASLTIERGKGTDLKNFETSYKWCFRERPAERWKREDIHKFIWQASEKYEVPVALLAAVIEVESAFNPWAVSRKGALGLMQLMPATCTRFKVRRPLDPEDNIEGGAKYLSYLLHQWSTQFPSHQRLEFCLAAYNAGEGRVERYGGIPPFKETKDYVRQVLKRYNAL